MSKLLKTRAALSLFGNERMNCKFYQFVAPDKLAEPDFIELLLKEEREHFGVHISGKFIGPFQQQDYHVGNYEVSPLGFRDLLNFYARLPEMYTKADVTDNPILLVDYLRLIVSSYEMLDGKYFTFKYNYLDKKDTVLFGKEQFQFDYFYQFLFIEPQRVSVGYIWYD